MTLTHDAFYDAQAQALYLEPTDLDANRQGVITDHQIDRVHGQMRAAALGLGCMIVISILPAVTFVVLLQNTVITAVIGLGLVILGLRFLVTWNDISKSRRLIETDLENGVATSLEGALEKRQTGQRAGHQLGIADEYFLVPRLVYDKAPVGESAIIYFLPESKQLLAIELIANQVFDGN